MLLWRPRDCAGDAIEILELAISGGVDAVQVRDKEANARELYETAIRARPIARDRRVLFFVNDRIDVALACLADGVHFGQEDLTIEDARSFAPSGFIIGISTHSIAQAGQARARGADLIGFGPMFPTLTKPQEAAIGPDELRTVEDAGACPTYAIGGLNAERILNIRARRAAVSSAILASGDPMRAAREIREALIQNGPIPRSGK